MDVRGKEARVFRLRSFCGRRVHASVRADARFERNISFEFLPRRQGLWRQREDIEFALLPPCCPDKSRSLRASASIDPNRSKCSLEDRPKIERPPWLVMKTARGANFQPSCPKESLRAKQRPVAMVEGRRAPTWDS